MAQTSIFSGNDEGQLLKISGLPPAYGTQKSRIAAAGFGFGMISHLVAVD
jgi:hypothetical protein